MATTLSTTVKAGIDWSFAETGFSASIPDNDRISLTATLGNTLTGNLKADLRWAQDSTVAVSTTKVLDLQALVETVIGIAGTRNFDLLKAIIFVNDGTVDLTIFDDNGSNLFVAPSSPLVVPAGSFVVLTDLTGGWTVGASTKNLEITNASASVVAEYRIVLIGESA